MRLTIKMWKKSIQSVNSCQALNVFNARSYQGSINIARVMGIQEKL